MKQLIIIAFVALWSLAANAQNSFPKEISTNPENPVNNEYQLLHYQLFDESISDNPFLNENSKGFWYLSLGTLWNVGDDQIQIDLSTPNQWETNFNPPAVNLGNPFRLNNSCESMSYIN